MTALTPALSRKAGEGVENNQAFVFAALAVVFFFFAAAFFFGAGLVPSAPAEGLAFAFAVFAVAAFFAQRPLRSGAAAISAWHSSRVSDFGSRSLGILPFFLPSVMYGP